MPMNDRLLMMRDHEERDDLRLMTSDQIRTRICLIFDVFVENCIESGRIKSQEWLDGYRQAIKHVNQAMRELEGEEYGGE